MCLDIEVKIRIDKWVWGTIVVEDQLDFFSERWYKLVKCEFLHGSEKDVSTLKTALKAHILIGLKPKILSETDLLELYWDLFYQRDDSVYKNLVISTEKQSTIRVLKELLNTEITFCQPERDKPFQNQILDIQSSCEELIPTEGLTQPEMVIFQQLLYKEQVQDLNGEVFEGDDFQGGDMAKGIYFRTKEGILFYSRCPLKDLLEGSSLLHSSFGVLQFILYFSFLNRVTWDELIFTFQSLEISYSITSSLPRFEQLLIMYLWCTKKITILQSSECHGVSLRLTEIPKNPVPQDDLTKWNSERLPVLKPLEFKDLGRKLSLWPNGHFILSNHSPSLHLQSLVPLLTPVHPFFSHSFHSPVSVLSVRILSSARSPQNFLVPQALLGPFQSDHSDYADSSSRHCCFSGLIPRPVVEPVVILLPVLFHLSSVLLLILFLQCSSSYERVCGGICYLILYVFHLLFPLSFFVSFCFLCLMLKYHLYDLNQPLIPLIVYPLCLTRRKGICLLFQPWRPQAFPKRPELVVVRGVEINGHRVQRCESCTFLSICRQSADFESQENHQITQGRILRIYLWLQSEKDGERECLFTTGEKLSVYQRTIFLCTVLWLKKTTTKIQTSCPRALWTWACETDMGL
ncbi:hypothetical protein VP01_2625g2 [Puccinia sorghi]|uniref:Uncharacterized protein n=1 Tax=Puccinia sorghi TaxID=27349 RepID=A0A0L6V4F7_9BASI|nr:hypothetical protein VP01_2625g2 [Puccinia sorghi]